MTKLLQSHDRSFMDEEFLLTGKQIIGLCLKGYRGHQRFRNRVVSQSDALEKAL